MKLKKMTALLLTAAVAASTLMGCGGSGNSASTSSSSGAKQQTQSGSAAEGSNTTADGKTQITGVAKVGIPTLYPFGGPADDSNSWKWQAYEFLYIYNMETGELEPQLAKDYQVSDDGLEYEIEIYDYIYDSEGNHITADDVVFCMQTAYDTGNFTNLGMSNLEVVEAIDEYTVRMKFSNYVIGAFEFIMEYIPIVSQKAYEETGDEMATKVVSTAPYKVTEFVSGSSISFEKRDDYWQTDESLICSYSQTNVDVINIKCINEISQRKIALQTGNVDVSLVDSESAAAMKSEGYGEYVVERPEIQYLQLSKAEGSPFADENFRKAVLCAIDRDALIEAVYGDYAEKAVLGLSFTSDFNEDWLNEEYPYEYDLDKAQEYLAASSYANGTTVKLVTQNDDVRKKMAEILQGYLSQIGVQLEIEYQEAALLSDTQRTPANYDMIITQKYGLYTAKIYNSLFDRRNYSSGTTLMGLVDDDLQALIEEACGAETHNQDTVDAVYDYVTEHALTGPVCWIRDPYIATSNCPITKMVTWDCGTPVYGACEYTWNA